MAIPNSLTHSLTFSPSPPQAHSLNIRNLPASLAPGELQIEERCVRSEELKRIVFNSKSWSCFSTAFLNFNSLCYQTVISFKSVSTMLGSSRKLWDNMTTQDFSIPFSIVCLLTNVASIWI